MQPISPRLSVDTATSQAGNASQPRPSPQNFPSQPGLAGLGIAGLFGDDQGMETPPDSAVEQSFHMDTKPSGSRPSTGTTSSGPKTGPIGSPMLPQADKMAVSKLMRSPLTPPVGKRPRREQAPQLQMTRSPMPSGPQPRVIHIPMLAVPEELPADPQADHAEALITVALPGFLSTQGGERQRLAAALARLSGDEQTRKIMLLTSLCGSNGRDRAPPDATIAAVAQLLMRAEADVLLDELDGQLAQLQALTEPLAERIERALAMLKPHRRPDRRRRKNR